MLKTTFFSEVKKVTKKFRRVDTQRDRAHLINDLKVILEVYKQHAAKNGKRGPPGKLEMKSAQLAAYIARSINIIARGYDAVKIKTVLEELAERVSRLEQLQKQDKNSGEKGRKPRKSS
jgi:flagellar motor component MotA